ncbi:hypothetical protein F511_12053 [Dorcoceras hygrometricum]|uniref:Uncharacterized protein n=1 Tax=Dorcoceras hygrometricum TaxID=472368 RepID=A0A2Z7DBI8_9LAMI|nr:hypothetical protein F511_12053 [Dorcoceras hygrometricum]
MKSPLLNLRRCWNCFAKSSAVGFALLKVQLLNSLLFKAGLTVQYLPSAESLARRQNAVVSTSSNDIVLLSLNFKYHLLDLTNPNGIVRVTSALLPPAGSPVATHYSQSPRCWFQNAAFQLNEMTSFHFFDCFPKPTVATSTIETTTYHPLCYSNQFNAELLVLRNDGVLLSRHQLLNFDHLLIFDLQVLDMLSNLHLFVIDELKVLSQAHGLRWEKPCCSTIFEGPNHDRGAVIARSKTNIKSTCWIRTMLRINGTWVIEPCADYWQQIPRVVASSIVVIPSRFSYVDTLPPVSEFFKLLKKRWADVCIEDATFVVFGKLLPVGSLNFCRAIAVVQPVSSFGFQRPTVTSWGWSQLCTEFFRYSLFSGLLTVYFSIFGSATVLIRSSLGTANIFDTDSSADSSLHFNANDISTEADAALDPFILPYSATDISASLAALRESFSKLIANQTRDSRKSGDVHSEVMCKINHVERVFLDSLAVQNEAFRGLFKSIRQEAQNDTNALSLALKAVRAQNAILSTDLASTQKEVKDLKVALSKDFDDKFADIRNDLLEFRVEAQEQLPSLGGHLAELIAFITKGNDDKQGEGSSSRPQPAS